MNVKKMFLVIVAVFSMVAFFGVNAYSAGWYTCRVEAAGPSLSIGYINLSDMSSSPAFSYRWFIAHPTYRKEMLATALAAQSNDQLVMVYLTGASAYSYVYSIFMLNTSSSSAISAIDRSLGSIMDNMPEPAAEVELE
jgi:hypothetical protein